jgi:hypothetical protein
MLRLQSMTCAEALKQFIALWGLTASDWMHCLGWLLVGRISLSLFFILSL